MEEKIMHLQDRYCLHEGSWTPITVRVQKWPYHGLRVKLTIIEGYYATSELIDKVLSEPRKNEHFLEHPKHFEIICSSEDMTEIGKALMKIYGQEE